MNLVILQLFLLKVFEDRHFENIKKIILFPMNQMDFV